jgi:hypothetical protein
MDSPGELQRLYVPTPAPARVAQPPFQPWNLRQARKQSVRQGSRSPISRPKSESRKPNAGLPAARLMFNNQTRRSSALILSPAPAVC